MDLKHKLERITANKDLLCTICHDKLSCKDSKKNCTESEDLITVLGEIALNIIKGNVPKNTISQQSLSTYSHILKLLASGAPDELKKALFIKTITGRKGQQGGKRFFQDIVKPVLRVIGPLIGIPRFLLK